MEPYDLIAEDPYRPVHWRWERAGRLLARGLAPSRAGADRWTRRAFAFRRRLAACRDEADQYQLLAADPAVACAYLLWGRRDEAQGRQQPHVLEARILAGQSDQVIAQRMGIAAATVKAYEALFFAVRAACAAGARDYIFFNVLGPSVYCGLREHQFDVIWKLYALRGGPHVLEALLGGGLGQPHPASAGGVAAFPASDRRASVALRAMITARTLALDGSNGLKLQAAVLGRDAQARDECGGGACDGALLPVKAFLDNLRSLVAPGAVPVRAGGAAKLQGAEINRRSPGANGEAKEAGARGAEKKAHGAVRSQNLAGRCWPNAIPGIAAGAALPLAPRWEGAAAAAGGRALRPVGGVEPAGQRPRLEVGVDAAAVGEPDEVAASMVTSC